MNQHLLDPISTAKVEELINKLKEKYTIVIVTHNMQQAIVLVIIQRSLYGRFNEHGKTEDILEIKKNEHKTI